ncbi:MAG: hypothetical protein HQL69_01755 [Magnetococcales bacterium]|nr:hypothetical protein [Magnetococcales bacterium]
MSKYIARLLSLIILTMALVGCSSAKPFAYEDQGEVKEGPGLFSGKKGEFIIYNK